MVGALFDFSFLAPVFGVVVSEASQLLYFVVPPSLENGGRMIHDFRVVQRAPKLSGN